MSQPVWKLVANLGDASPLEYGGYFVYRDETGVYPPEAEWVEEPADDRDIDHPKARWTVYRVVLDSVADPDSEWFGDSLDMLAEQFDPPMDIRSDLASNDPVRLALAYREIGSYHGWENLDGYPEKYTLAEMQERYPEFA